MKNILLLDRSLSVNGTSVYYKNLSNSALGDKVNLYFFPFRRHVYYSEITSQITVIKLIPFFSRQYKIDVIYACTVEMFILALLLKKYFFKQANIVYSVLHPRQNFFEKNFFGQIYEKIIYKKMLESPEVFVFCNELVKRSHSEYYKLPLTYSRIFPVLISGLEVARDVLPPFKMAPKTINIVSLGRLVDFKYYHEVVIRAISEIRQLNQEVNIVYHIYGDGYLRDELKRYIKNVGASEFALIHGHLNIDELYSVLSSADLFIGQGTSLVYAASLGVPAICAVESSELTYGFFTDDMLGYEFGEDTGDTEKITYLSVLNDFLQMREAELTKLKCKTIEKSKQYLLRLNLDQFLSLLNEPTDGLTGVSIITFFCVLYAKVAIKLLPKYVGDK